MKRKDKVHLKTLSCDIDKSKVDETCLSQSLSHPRVKFKASEIKEGNFYVPYSQREKYHVQFSSRPYFITLLITFQNNYLIVECTNLGCELWNEKCEIKLCINSFDVNFRENYNGIITITKSNKMMNVNGYLFYKNNVNRISEINSNFTKNKEIMISDEMKLNLSNGLYSIKENNDIVKNGFYMVNVLSKNKLKKDELFISNDKYGNLKKQNNESSDGKNSLVICKKELKEVKYIQDKNLTKICMDKDCINLKQSVTNNHKKNRKKYSKFMKIRNVKYGVTNFVCDAVSVLLRCRSSVHLFVLWCCAFLSVISAAAGHYETSWKFYNEEPCCLNENRLQNKDFLSEFSCGRLYYRTLHLDEKNGALYVGAIDHIFRLNLENISTSSCEKDSLYLEPTDVGDCILRGKSEDFECRNHIRTIEEIGQDLLYICGTNAHNPRDLIVYKNLKHLPRHIHYAKVGGRGKGRCAESPETSSVSLMVSKLHRTTRETLQSEAEKETNTESAKDRIHEAINKLSISENIARGNLIQSKVKDAAKDEVRKDVYEETLKFTKEERKLLFAQQDNPVEEKYQKIDNFFSLVDHNKKIGDFDQNDFAKRYQASERLFREFLSNNAVSLMAKADSESGFGNNKKVIKKQIPNLSNEGSNYDYVVDKIDMNHRNSSSNENSYSSIDDREKNIVPNQQDIEDFSRDVMNRSSDGSFLFSAVSDGSDPLLARWDLRSSDVTEDFPPYIRTIMHDTAWLDSPEFVSMVAFPPHALVFFHERVSCPLHVSGRRARVARVCLMDKPAPRHKHHWTTYVKADITCAGQHYSRLEAVYQTDSRIFASFTTPQDFAMPGSAICSYSLDSISRGFRGGHAARSGDTVEAPSPGVGECNEDTTKLSDAMVNFARSHPRMQTSILPDLEAPVFIEKDVFFTKLVVDHINYGNEKNFTVFYAGTNKGLIYKIVQWFHNAQTFSHLQDVWKVFPDEEPLTGMVYSKFHSSLYVASDSRTVQIRVKEVCGRQYDSCFRCYRDPYCGWDYKNEGCLPYQTGLFQDVSDSSLFGCDNFVQPRQLSATFGQSIFLGHFSTVPEVVRRQPIMWSKTVQGSKPEELNYRSDKYILTSDHGLVVMGLNLKDSCLFECRQGRRLLAAYNLTVDSNRCYPPTQNGSYHKIYLDWCREFLKHKMAMKRWQTKTKEQCKNTQENWSEKRLNEVFPVD